MGPSSVCMFGQQWVGNRRRVSRQLNTVSSSSETSSVQLWAIDFLGPNFRRQAVFFTFLETTTRLYDLPPAIEISKWQPFAELINFDLILFAVVKWDKMFLSQNCVIQSELNIFLLMLSTMIDWRGLISATGCSRKYPSPSSGFAYLFSSCSRDPRLFSNCRSCCHQTVCVLA